MNDFEYDVMQRASVARSARCKVASVRGPKGCSLPSDNLTPAQIRKLSGEPVSYRLDSPMTWREFRAMPDDLQAVYLRKLIAAYGVNAKVLGKMFGVNNQTVLNKQNKLGSPPANRGARMDEKQEKLWQAFLEGKNELQEEGTVEETDISEVYSVKKDLEIEKTLADLEKLPTERLCLDHFTASVTGEYSPEAMMAILGTMPIPEGKCTIRIEVAKV